MVCISYGDYEQYVDRITAAGAVAATQVGTMDDVRRAADAGVDLLVARGGEGGGHGRDSVATLPLLQAVLDATDLPVLAAGGIATARGLAAVLAAGAAGGWVGTAFLATDESAYKDGHKDAVIGAELDSSVYTTVFDIGRGSPWPEEFGGRGVAQRLLRHLARTRGGAARGPGAQRRARRLGRAGGRAGQGETRPPRRSSRSWPAPNAC